MVKHDGSHLVPAIFGLPPPGSHPTSPPGGSGAGVGPGLGPGALPPKPTATQLLALNSYALESLWWNAPLLIAQALLLSEIIRTYPAEWAMLRRIYVRKKPNLAEMLFFAIKYTSLIAVVLTTLLQFTRVPGSDARCNAFSWAANIFTLAICSFVVATVAWRTSVVFHRERRVFLLLVGGLGIQLAFSIWTLINFFRLNKVLPNGLCLAAETKKAVASLTPSFWQLSTFWYVLYNFLFDLVMLVSSSYRLWRSARGPLGFARVSALLFANNVHYMMLVDVVNFVELVTLIWFWADVPNYQWLVIAIQGMAGMQMLVTEQAAVYRSAPSTTMGTYNNARLGLSSNEPPSDGRSSEKGWRGIFHRGNGKRGDSRDAMGTATEVSGATASTTSSSTLYISSPIKHYDASGCSDDSPPPLPPKPSPPRAFDEKVVPVGEQGVGILTSRWSKGNSLSTLGSSCGATDFSLRNRGSELGHADALQMTMTTTTTMVACEEVRSCPSPDGIEEIHAAIPRRDRPDATHLERPSTGVNASISTFASPCISNKPVDSVSFLSAGQREKAPSPAPFQRAESSFEIPTHRRLVGNGAASTPAPAPAPAPSTPPPSVPSRSYTPIPYTPPLFSDHPYQQRPRTAESSTSCATFTSFTAPSGAMNGGSRLSGDVIVDVDLDASEERHDAPLSSSGRGGGGTGASVTTPSKSRFSSDGDATTSRLGHIRKKASSISIRPGTAGSIGSNGGTKTRGWMSERLDGFRTK